MIFLTPTETKFLEKATEKNASIITWPTLEGLKNVVPRKHVTFVQIDPYYIKCRCDSPFKQAPITPKFQSNLRYQKTATDRLEF